MKKSDSVNWEATSVLPASALMRLISLLTTMPSAPREKPICAGTARGRRVGVRPSRRRRRGHAAADLERPERYTFLPHRHVEAAADEPDDDQEDEQLAEERETLSLPLVRHLS